MGNRKNKKKKKQKKEFNENEKENLKVLGRGCWYEQGGNETAICENHCEMHSASFHKLSANT